MEHCELHLKKGGISKKKEKMKQTSCLEFLAWTTEQIKENHTNGLSVIFLARTTDQKRSETLTKKTARNTDQKFKEIKV